MKKKILWIEDDFYSIRGLLRPLELEGYKIIPAISALDGFREAQKWREYDLIVVDLIVPIAQQEVTVPDIVKTWGDERVNRHIGVGLVKWLVQSLNVTCPVLILSVVRDPILVFGLESLGLAGYIQKSGILPTDIKNKIIETIKASKLSKSK